VLEETLNILPSDEFFKGIHRAGQRVCLTHGRGGVAEPLRKTKKNGVKNLNGAQNIPEFHY
jgi:hypothetical protein